MLRWLGKRWTKIKLFLDTPQVKFLLRTHNFAIYLIIFSFVILSARPDFAANYPSSSEWALFLFWFSFIVTEAKQLYLGDVKTLDGGKRKTVWVKIQKYWQSFWNRYDVFLLLYLFVMIGVRIGILLSNKTLDKSANYNTTVSENVTVTENSTVYDHENRDVAVLNLYSFYFVLWVIRILQLFAVSQYLGPKLIMIRLMIGDVVRIFLYIMLFAVAYAVWLKVALKTVMDEFVEEPTADRMNDVQPTIVEYFLSFNRTDVPYFLHNLMTDPFWHLFGENSLDAYNNHLPKTNETSAYNYEYRVSMIHFVAPVIRIIYVILCVVLLLNLLIAIFQYSINKVHEQADCNWNIYRKGVIFEYHNMSILPEPLSLIFDLLRFVCWLFRIGLPCEWRHQVIRNSKRFDCSALKICRRREKRQTIECSCHPVENDEEDNTVFEWLDDKVVNWEKKLLEDYLKTEKTLDSTESNIRYLKEMMERQQQYFKDMIEQQKLHFKEMSQKEYTEVIMDGK